MQKLEAVQMYNAINLKKIFLVGEKAKLKTVTKPFDKNIIKFLKDLSKKIDSEKNLRKYPDLKALSFFCREKNILSLKKKYDDNNILRFGLGLLFHITPANIPTNFAYSLIFGLITGNSNIVKVPSKEFEEINIICKCINSVLRLKKHKKAKDMISIIRYSDNDDLTKKYSLICDGRLIWGGDKTISNLKKFETKPKNIDIPFSDRYSITLINSENFLDLPKYKRENLAKNFFNDTYIVDQNACSSPHIVIWYGKKFSNSSKQFWSYLDTIIRKKYKSPLISSVDNYSRLASDFLKINNIKSHKIINKSLYVVTLNKIKSPILIEKSKWGFFYELNISELKNIKYLTNRKLQTLTYFGFKKEELTKLFRENNFNGIDRVVPIGQALNINLVWDGYDIVKILSREIEIR